MAIKRRIYSAKGKNSKICGQGNLPVSFTVKTGNYNLYERGYDGLRTVWQSGKRKIAKFCIFVRHRKNFSKLTAGAERLELNNKVKKIEARRAIFVTKLKN